MLQVAITQDVNPSQVSHHQTTTRRTVIPRMVENASYNVRNNKSSFGSTGFPKKMFHSDFVARTASDINASGRFYDQYSSSGYCEGPKNAFFFYFTLL